MLSEIAGAGPVGCSDGFGSTPGFATLVSSANETNVRPLRSEAPGGLEPLLGRRRPLLAGPVARCRVQSPREIAPTIPACFADAPRSRRHGWHEPSDS